MLIGPLTVNYRPGSHDEKAIKEVMVRREYLRAGRIRLDPADHWLDLGAHIGTFTLLALAAGCLVDSYEPHPENCALLQSNVRQNGLQNHWCGHEAAVLAYPTHYASLHVDTHPGKTYRHTMLPHAERSDLLVAVEPFASALNKTITAVKMDIEGAEHAILDSAPDWGNVRQIVFEYHFDYDREVDHFHRRMNTLRDAGFTVHHRRTQLEPGTRWSRFPAADTVFAWR